MPLSSVCIYCGSSDLVAHNYKQAAQNIGSEIAKRGLRLVYGGGHVGLMGIVADAALSSGGIVTGIIPEHIKNKEVQHDGLTELLVVPDMHTRKRMMIDRADAFIILPGGLGTLDESFEILTWKKLKLHDKPIIIFNQNGFWDEMLALIKKTVSEAFSQPPDLSLYEEVRTEEELLALLNKLQHA